ncbi:MAG: EF-hand domain-containing protein [Rhodospirillales bacterium]|nr:EF-hand domain-containing protein [Rhodospirillales bacterium]
MKSLFRPLLFTAAVMSLPAVAQTPPTQGWPANRPPTAQPGPQATPPQAATPPAAGAPAAPAPGGQSQQATGAPPPPIPLPQWFVEIDTAKKGEVSRADFLKYRMKSFEELDANKDGKLSLDEFVKVAEPPMSSDVPGGPTLEERRNRAKAEFQNLDTNRDGFVERAEAEALVHSEFNQYDTDRDNKVTEPEVRLIVQRSLQREAAARQEVEQRRRQGMAAINDFIDMQLREADKLDKNNDGRINQQEYLVLTGPADGPQAKGLLPYDIRKQLVLRKFAEIDTNKDGQLDRVELTGAAVKQFLEIDANKDRFLTEDEFKHAQENETKKMRAIIQAMQPAQPAQPRPAPAQPRAAQPQQAPQMQQPQGLAPGLPQGTR